VAGTSTNRQRRREPAWFGCHWAKLFDRLVKIPESIALYRVQRPSMGLNKRPMISDLNRDELDRRTRIHFELGVILNDSPIFG
jgi:hypothetical protein